MNQTDQTEQINHPFVEDSYYHPYSAKHQEEMNLLTHFPADYNQRFEESKALHENYKDAFWSKPK